MASTSGTSAAPSERIAKALGAPLPGVRCQASSTQSARDHGPETMALVAVLGLDGRTPQRLAVTHQLLQTLRPARHLADHPGPVPGSAPPGEACKCLQITEVAASVGVSLLQSRRFPVQMPPAGTTASNRPRGGNGQFLRMRSTPTGMALRQLIRSSAVDRSSAAERVSVIGREKSRRPQPMLAAPA